MTSLELTLEVEDFLEIFFLKSGFLSIDSLSGSSLKALVNFSDDGLTVSFCGNS